MNNKCIFKGEMKPLPILFFFQNWHFIVISSNTNQQYLEKKHDLASETLFYSELLLQFQIFFLCPLPFVLILDRVKQLCKRYQRYLYCNSEPSATAIFGALCAKGMFQCRKPSNTLGRHRGCLAHSGELYYRHSDLTNMCIVSNTLSSVVLIPTFVRILTNHSFEGLLGCTSDSSSHSDFKAVLLVFTFLY